MGHRLIYELMATAGLHVAHVADYHAWKERQYQRTYYAKNKDKCKASQRAWREKHPEYMRQQSRKWREKQK
jgi:hypothetical protein